VRRRAELSFPLARNITRRCGVCGPSEAEKLKAAPGGGKNPTREFDYEVLGSSWSGLTCNSSPEQDSSWLGGRSKRAGKTQALALGQIPKSGLVTVGLPSHPGVARGRSRWRGARILQNSPPSWVMG
jgi:hypothetical protein